MSAIKSALAATSFTFQQVEPAVKRIASTTSKSMDVVDHSISALNTYAQRWEVDAKASLIDALEERANNKGLTVSDYLTQLNNQYNQIQSVLK